MTEFLSFLNSADAQELMKIPGIDAALAAEIVAARPYSFVEDAAQATGMSKNFLAEAQSYYEVNLNPHPERPRFGFDGIRTAAREFWARLRGAAENVGRSALRLLITIAVILAVGVALYYGLPYINKQFMAPVAENSQQIDHLESEIATLQAKLDQTRGSVQALQTSAAAQDTLVQQLQSAQGTLAAQLQQEKSDRLAAVIHQLGVTRALESLNRARLYLAMNQLDAARSDIASARDVLVSLRIDREDPALESAISQLDNAVKDLPANSTAAAAELETAWQALFQPAAAGTQAVISTFTPAVTATATPTP